MNLILNTDSYKAAHYLIQAPKQTKNFSYIESRGGKDKETVFFGLQYICKKYLTKQIKQKHIKKSEKFFTAHGLPFNKKGWQHIVDEHDGYLPLRIRSVKEGSVIPTHNCLVTVENTCNECAWVVSYFETLILRIWYPISVATESYQIKQIIKSYLEKTCDDPIGNIDFRLHDFGARGVSSQESAEIGGMAHLVNFKGSDTVAGIVAANKYYHHDMAGFSIPASEHSVVLSYGPGKEVDLFKSMLNQFGKPGGIFACVSDTVDIYAACSDLWGGELKQQVIDSGATVVIRPDSGNPPDVVERCLNILAEKFGTTTNKKGFKVLNYVRLIQGDGINRNSIVEIYDRVVNAGFSVENVALGMGGALLQDHRRDDFNFAMKQSYVVVDGVGMEVSKNPVTQSMKKSKEGKLDLIYDNGEYKTVKINGTSHAKSIMVNFFEDGKLLYGDNLETIRARSEG